MVGSAKTDRDQVKEAAKEIIHGLTEADFATVMVYDSEVVAARSSLVQMHEAGRAEFLQWLDDTPPGQISDTNWESALTAAYRAFDSCNSPSVSTCTGCQKVILFITDGEPSLGKKEQSLMGSSLFEDQPPPGGFRILTYSHDDGGGLS